ncbi:MAG TPA: efflux RND transporter permease subunit [Polyangiaceae bacterium]|nr:efflux RND transporter permease subunit [Polyangiaceae bacterium]
MQWLAALCIRQPVLTWVLMLAIVVIGGVGYTSLGVDQFPKIDIPFIMVSTTLNGAAPEVVETAISDKIEAAVNTISGIDELRSTSSDGVSLVLISFALEKDIDVAAQEVRDHLNTALPELPKGVDQPVVTKLDPDAAPILLVTFRANGSVRDVTELADKRVRRLIESINGVGQVSILGGQKRQVNLWLDPPRLAAAGLTAADVQRALAAQNLTVPGGTLDTGPRRISVRVEGRVASVERIGQIVVRELNGHATRVSDVARVEDGETELSSYASEDGKATVVLSIRKQSGQNTVAVVDAVKDKLASVEKTLPAGSTLRVVRDNSQAIRTSLNAVKEHLVLGAVLAAIVVLLFLGDFRSTFIAALAIPISIIGTFALMSAIGFTLNLITLLALALAVGIVIDDAIVVLENITRFVREKRQKPFVAAVLATREIGLPVLATTLSLLAVFLPVAFMSGIIGRFFRSFGMTMAFAIAVSLLVSFTLTPMLSARLLSPVPPEGEVRRSWLERASDRLYLPVERLYTKVLRWVMFRRWVVLVACAVTLGTCVPVANAVPKGFQPENDMAEFEVHVRAPEGTSLFETRLIAERIASEIRQLPTVRQTLVTIGGDQLASRNVANVYARLVDPRDRDQTQLEIMNYVRREIVTKQRKDLRLEVAISQQISSGQSSASVQYTIYGPDLARLEQYTKQILERFRQVPGAVDVDSNLVVGNPEVRVVVDRERAANLGVDVATIASTVQLLIGGLKVSTYQEGGEEYDIRLRAEAGYRTDLSGLSVMTVPTRAGGSVPLASVVTLRETVGPSQINRLARQRQVTIMGNVAPGVGQSTVSDALKSIIDELHMPPEYRAVPAGLTREQGRIITAFVVAIAMTAIFMYLVLAAQFASWIHPVTIMLALPLTIPFAFLSLLLFRQELSIMSALGIIVLFGVVKKNAILQVDHTNQLRAHGKERLEAILEANRDRLRPILMTTLAFVAGMIPLVLSRGVGAGMNRSIAGVVVGGQTLSLALTLLATPVAYSYFDDAAAWLRRVRGKSKVDRGEDQVLGARASSPEQLAAEE